MFFLHQVNRGNITPALSNDALADRGLSNDEYQTGQTVYFASLLLAALPSQLVGQSVGVATWMSLQLIAWSIASSMQIGVSGPWSFWAIQASIGVFEGGFVPSAVLYLSYFYTSEELPKRLALFSITYPAAYIMCTLSSVVIVRLSSIWEIPGWRWVVGAEAALTFFTGCAAWLYLPAAPTKTASPLPGEQAWFTTFEEKIIVNRLLRDDPGKGDSYHTGPLTLRQILLSILNYRMWPLYLMALTWQLQTFPINQYLTTNLLHMALETYQRQLAHLPSPAIWVFNTLAFTFISEWLDERLILSTLSQIWVLPMLVANFCLPTDRDLWHTWVLTMLGCAQPYVHAILLGLASRNAGTGRDRAVMVALYVMAVQASDVIGSKVRIPSNTSSRDGADQQADVPERRCPVLFPGFEDPDHSCGVEHCAVPGREVVVHFHESSASKETGHDIAARSAVIRGDYQGHWQQEAGF
jgi:hypothetical protein